MRLGDQKKILQFAIRQDIVPHRVRTELWMARICDAHAAAGVCCKKLTWKRGMRTTTWKCITDIDVEGEQRVILDRARGIYLMQGGCGVCALATEMSCWRSGTRYKTWFCDHLNA